MQRLLSVSALSALSLAVMAALPTAANAAAPWSGTRTLAATDVDAAATGAELQPGTVMHISVSLALRNKSELDDLTARIMSGKTTQHLTPAQVQARFSPTPEQANAVADYLRSAGFTHVEIAKNRVIVTADGTAATVKAAFNTELRHVKVDGRDAYANVKPAQVPAHLAGIVNGVHGLENVHLLHLPHHVAQGSVIDGIVGHNPADFAQVYDAAKLPPATNTTIGIISSGSLTGTLQALGAFVSQNGYPTPTVHQIPAGAQGTGTSGAIEWDLDSQTMLATAGGQLKAINFYIGHDAQTLQALVPAFNAAAADGTANIVNASLGLCETGEAANGDEAAIDASLEMGVAQGQTWTISSGDSGAYECARSKIGASYPAVSPYATAIGGTTLNTTGTTVYASETAWSCKGYLSCLQLLGGSGGGGTSTTEPQPTWQAASIGSMTGRAIPDISFSADPNSGSFVVINGSGQTEQVGGTSLSSPMFAGMWARIESQHGNSIGYPNAVIYKYTPTSIGTRYIHDVTSGSQGFSAGPGWDLATGFGSVDIGVVAGLIK